MKTVVAPSVRRNADCPYHSTCMLLLEFGRAQTAGDRCGGGLGQRRRGSCARRAAATPRPRSGRRRSRTANAACSPSRNGPEIRLGKNELPGERRLVVRRQRREHVRRRAGAGSGCSRGTRRTGSTPAAACATWCAVGGATPCACSPALSVCGQRRGQPDDHQREEDADREHLGGVLERLVHRRRRRRGRPRGRLFITAARLGEANRPIDDPDQQQDRAERRDRRSRSAAAAAARSRPPSASIPPVANGRAPKRSDR